MRNMKCPQCHQMMTKNSYPVKGVRSDGPPFPCMVHYFTCKGCQVKLRFLFVREADFQDMLTHYQNLLKRERERVRELETKIQLLQIEGPQAIKKLLHTREMLQKILRGLF